MLKRFGKWSLIGMVVCMALLGIFSNCVSFKTDPETAAQAFQARKWQPTYRDYQVNNRRQSYVHVGDVTKPLVVFVHGSPGDWGAFLGFMADKQLLLHAQMVSVDRPGFGRSQRGDHVASLTEQAALLKPAVAAHASRQRPAILVGHSLGGPLIARMAMDYPELVAGLIMIAPSIDPDLEKVRWFQYPANWKIFSWMLPTDLVVSNREILPLEGELVTMLPHWADLQVPVTLIQGGADRLVPAANAHFAQRVLTHAPLDMVLNPRWNHFVLWTEPAVINRAIMRHLQPPASFLGAHQQP